MAVDPQVVNSIRQLLDAVPADLREQIIQNVTNPQPGFRHPVFDAIGRLLERVAPEFREETLRQAAPPGTGNRIVPVPPEAGATPPAGVTPSPGATPPSGGPPPPPPNTGAPPAAPATTPATPAPIPNETPPYGPAPPNTFSPPVPATQDVYDWHRVNEALASAGLNGWQISGNNHIPVNQGKWVKNPLYDVYKDASPRELADAGLTEMPAEFTYQEGTDYVIGVHNPTTNQMLKLTLSRSGRDPQTNGYSYSVTGRQDQGALEQTNPGHKDIQKLTFQDGRTELWATNTQTGAFERLPNQPAGLGTLDAATKGWNDVRQVEQPDGSMVWVGTPPLGAVDAAGVPLGNNPFTPVPNAPVLKGSSKHENVRQVTKNGRQVYVGYNKQTGAWEDIPEFGSEVVAPTRTTSPSGNVIYQPDANGNLVPVPGIAQPVEGVSTRWVDAGGGYAKQQTFRNGDWSDDVDVARKLVDPAVTRAAGAIRPKGERYETPMTINGTTRLVTVEADGNGGYTIPKDTTSRPFPGAPLEKPVTPTVGEQEFISRYNPETGQQENVKNPNWSPEATGDRVRQLRELAAAKQQELSTRIGKNGYTAEQAQREFDTYWDTQIEPRRQQLQFDQEQERRKAERDEQTARQTALTTAQTTGQNAVANYQAMQKNMVGPGFAQASREMQGAIAEGRTPTINPEAYQYQGPNLNELAQYHTARALQHISPTAAGLLGGQPTLPQAVQGMDMSSLLNRTAFRPQPQGGVTINVNAGGATTTTPPQTGADPAAAARAALAAQPFNAFGPTAVDDPYGRTNALV